MELKYSKGDNVKVITAKVIDVDSGDCDLTYRVEFPDGTSYPERMWFKENELELVSPAASPAQLVPPGWHAINEHPESDTPVNVMIDNKHGCPPGYLGHYDRSRLEWYPRNTTAWREIEPAKPIIPPGWTPASEQPVNVDKTPSLRDVRIMLNSGRVAVGWHGSDGTSNYWRMYIGDPSSENWEPCHTVKCWQELDAPEQEKPAEPAPKYHKGDRVWLHLLGTGEFVPATFNRYTVRSGKVIVRRDDKLTNRAVRKGWKTTEDQLSPMLPEDDPREVTK